MKKIIYSISFLLIVLFAATSCVVDDVYVGPPTISTFSINPLAPKATDSVQISATITDQYGLSSVKLYYQVGTGGSYTSIDMAATGSVYSAKIPPQIVTSVVSYYVEAINTKTKTTYAPSTAPTTVASYTVGAAVNPIVLNEVCGLTSPDNDWIELYNLSSSAVNIGGYSVFKTDELGATSTQVTIPTGTTMAANAYLVIHKTAVAPETIILASGISNTKNVKLELKNAAGTTISTFEKTATTPNVAGHISGGSYARIPNGTGDWAVVTVATPGAANVSN